MSIEEIRKQAQHENTAPEILAKLANSQDKEILRHVASNPNTPVETLEKLGKKFPDEITANPIFELLLLENPESKFIQLSLARSSTTSSFCDKISDEASPPLRDRTDAITTGVCVYLILNPIDISHIRISSSFPVLANDPQRLTPQSCFATLDGRKASQSSEGRRWHIRAVMRRSPKGAK